MRKVNLNLTDIILAILVVILIILIALFVKEYNYYRTVVAPCWKHIDQGQYTKAIEYYSQVKSSHPSLLSCVATAYYYQGDYTNALVFFKKAEEEGMEAGVNTLLKIADTYENIGDIDDALKYYKKALKEMKYSRREIRSEYKQRYRETLYKIASLYERKGETEKAEEYRSCAVRLCKDI